MQRFVIRSRNAWQQGEQAMAALTLKWAASWGGCRLGLATVDLTTCKWQRAGVEVLPQDPWLQRRRVGRQHSRWRRHGGARACPPNCCLAAVALTPRSGQHAADHQCEEEGCG